MLARYSNWSHERLPRSLWTGLTFIASSKRSFLTPGMPLHTIIRACCVNKSEASHCSGMLKTFFLAMEGLQNLEKLLERNFIPTPEFVYPTTYLYTFWMHSTAWPLHSRIILASQESNGNPVAKEVWMLGVEQQQRHQHEHQHHQPCFQCSIPNSQAHFRQWVTPGGTAKRSLMHGEHLRSILKGQQLGTYIKDLGR